MITLDRQKKTGLLMIGICLLLVLLTALTFMKKDEKAEEEQGENVYHEISEGNSAEVSDSKREAYAAEDTRRPKIVDHWEECIEKETQEEIRREEEKIVHHEGSSGASSRELFGPGDSPSGSQPVRTYENPYRETPQEREERHRRRQEEAIEMAERMQGMTQDDDTSDIIDGQVEIPQEKVAVASDVRRTSVISSLDGTGGTGGVSSLGNDDEIFTEEEDKPFRCMFSKETKLRTGDRVSIILQEDMIVAGTLVPRNTHLMASCRIGARLELEIASLESGGRIIPLGYEAYDIDGSKGIYCPDVGNEGKTIRSRGTNIINSSLNSRVGRVAGDVLNTGVSLLQGRDGETTVSVPAGYSFFIMKRKEQ